MTVLCHISFAQQNVTDVVNMQNTPKIYQILKTNNPIVIDGKAEETAWDNAAWTDYFVDIEGENKNKPNYNSKVKMLWDNQNLYIYAHLEEPHIWGDLTNHDAIIYHNNDFEVFIKPYENQSSYYEIEINTLNTILDLMLNKPYKHVGEAILHWDTKGLKSAIHCNGTNNNPNDVDNYWSIEMAIPFQALQNFGRSSSPRSGEYWRMNFSRVQWQHEIIKGKYERKKINNKLLPEDNWVWSPIGLVNMHYPERWGYVQFTDATSDSLDYPKSQKIEHFTWNIHYLQNIFKNKHNKYSKDLIKLQDDHDLLGSDLSTYTHELIMNKDANYYRIEIYDPENKITTTIDSYGNYQIKYD